MTLERTIKKLFRAYRFELMVLDHKYKVALEQAIARAEGK